MSFFAVLRSTSDGFRRGEQQPAHSLEIGGIIFLARDDPLAVLLGNLEDLAALVDLNSGDLVTGGLQRRQHRVGIAVAGGRPGLRRNISRDGDGE